MDFATTIVNFLSSVSAGHALTYGYLTLICVIIGVLLKMSSDKNLKFHLIDTISNPDGTASLTRMLQLTAGLTGTWVIVQSTIGKWLTVELFMVYLGAMGISEGFTKFINAKYSKDMAKEEEK